MPPLAALLSLPLPEDAPFLQLSPERQRERGVQALSALLQRLAEKRPLVFVVEDVHWADPSTLQFLGFLLEHIERLRVCVLLTARPELTHAWADHPGFHELRLAPLSPEATAALVQETAHGRALPAGDARQLVARTDGIPLFVEELTRMVLERSGTAGLPPEGALPSPPPCTSCSWPGSTSSRPGRRRWRSSRPCWAGSSAMKCSAPSRSSRRTSCGGTSSSSNRPGCSSSRAGRPT